MSEVLIHAVTGIEAEIQKTFPPKLVVKAKGEVVNNGFTQPKLNPYYYVAPPADGIYEFAFVANKPEGEAEETITLLEAEPFMWENFPEDLKGIKIYSETNSL